MTTTLERLQALLEKDFELDRARLPAEARLEDLDIDSLRMIEILFSVEDAFGVRLPEDQGALRQQLRTVGDLADFIDALVAGQGADPEPPVP